MSRILILLLFFFSSRRRHTRWPRDWSSDVCSSDLEDTKRFIRLAHDMGIPCIRISTGRWGTTGSLSELMDLRGEEPPIEGYTEEDAFQWCVEEMEQFVPVVEDQGVMLGVENQWVLALTVVVCI